jgi:hypothetical protein
MLIVNLRVGSRRLYAVGCPGTTGFPRYEAAAAFDRIVVSSASNRRANR